MDTSALATDMYQLAMLQGYFRSGMRDTAVFEFFARRLPGRRNFLTAAGLAQALAFLESLRFTPDELEWLESTGQFEPDFLEHLATFKFQGDVYAPPEGTILFADEPMLRVTAPLPQAQLVESRLINLLHFQTMIASKAARAVLAAPGRLLVDFGFRRAHGAEAGILAARAAYIAGFSGTATVAAGREFGIPLYGTMAHSFVQAGDSEAAAFRAFARANRQAVVLLLDTYDTERAAREVVRLAPGLARDGIAIHGVRIDSGDLAAHARAVRRILDAGGLAKVTIFASGGLDEYALAKLAAERAPIDGFGVGTALDVSADAPYLDCAYKLVEYAGRPRRKRSEGKATWPGRKQVHRSFDAAGRMNGDIVTLAGDVRPGEPLLRLVMRGGRRVAAAESLDVIRRRAAEHLAQLPDRLRSLDAAEPYPVEISPALLALAVECDAAERAGAG
ncbi:MAG: nicotinate phosphoribosyltransferase [Planctomycetia bacterium]|nr:nicotinate phosphoribosyltransferase [Planctomycetia bacterium]